MPSDPPSFSLPASFATLAFGFLEAFLVPLGGFGFDQQQGVVDLNVAVAEVEAGERVAGLAVGGAEEVACWPRRVRIACDERDRGSEAWQVEIASVSSQNAIAPTAILPSFQ